jgi:hypothetical protein
MDYKTMKIENIIEWCVANKQVEWLKAEVAKPFYNKDGSARKITFVELKINFVRKFMPEIAPKATGEKKPTMFELIDAL